MSHEFLAGRTRELTRLHELALGALDGGSGRVIVVSAPPGAGKSTLIAALLERIAVQRAAVAIARGRCLPSFGTGEPYLPFIDALRDLGDESTPGYVEGTDLSSLVQELAPYWLSVVPLIGSFLSATLTTTLALSGRAKPREAPSREALFVQYLELLRRLAERAPLVLLLEDMHWADHASIALLAHVARGVTRHRMLIIASMRPLENEGADAELNDVVLELERERIATRIHLGDLDDAGIAALLAHEFGGDVAEPLRRWMTRTAGGNPLFLTELARLLLQSGGVRDVHGEWDLTPAAQSVGVPRSAEAVIEKRIQRLDDDSVRLLQYASIQGNQFDSAVLAGLLGMDELDVLDALARLDRTHQLVHEAGQLELPDGDSAVVYGFRHALMQTVLYSQLASKRRVLLHRKAGEVVESIFARDLERVAGELALHYHEGRVAGAAFRHAGVAAAQAFRVYAYWEAERFLQIALEHASDAALRADVHEQLGDVYERLGHYARAVADYEQALTQERAADGGHAGTEAAGVVAVHEHAAAAAARVQRKICIAQRKAALLPAPVLLQRVRALLHGSVAATEERCRLLLEITRLPNAADVAEAAAEAVQIAQSLGRAALVAEALSQLAVVRMFAGRTSEALPVLDEALAVAQGTGDIVAVARCHSIAGVAHARHGRYRDARDRFHDMLQQYERIGDPHAIAAACTNLGALMLRLGDLDDAEAALQRARVIHERRDRSYLVQSLLNLAVCARLAGKHALAQTRFAEMALRAQEHDHWSAEAVAYAGLGLCALEQGRADVARAQAMRAQAAIADRADWFEDRDVVETLLARLEVLDGSPAAAAHRLARAAAALATRDVYLWARLELERADVLRALDAHGAAGIVSGVEAATAQMQSPPLARDILRQRELVESGAQ